jgi:glucosyl-3-phosphoglycerate synthase
MALVLPCLYSELEHPALQKIISELNGATYLDQVVIGLDRASEAEYRHALQYFQQLKIPHTVIWNDGPRIQNLQNRLKETLARHLQYLNGKRVGHNVNSRMRGLF